MAAQFSVACGLPLSIILLKGLPTEDAHGFTDSLAPQLRRRHGPLWPPDQLVSTPCMERAT